MIIIISVNLLDIQLELFIFRKSEGRHTSRDGQYTYTQPL